MGCDIHLFVEAKNPGTGKWEHRPDAPHYDRRSYSAFAILANVRNGYGFAGVKTGDGFNIIAEPKGIPEDISPEANRASKDWGCDGHSHSFLNLKEMLDFDWEQITRHQGVVSAQEYAVAKAEGQPRSWSGGVWGRDIKHVDNEEMDRLIAAGATDSNHYTTFFWEESYKESAGEFYEDFLPALQEFAAAHGLASTDVRIVFWFDN